MGLHSRHILLTCSKPHAGSCKKGQSAPGRLGISKKMMQLLHDLWRALLHSPVDSFVIPSSIELSQSGGWIAAMRS